MSENTQVSTASPGQFIKKSLAVKDYLELPAYKKRFEQVLGERAPQYIASIANAATMAHLKDCEQTSIIASSFVAATLDLPIDKNLGFAHLVPYNTDVRGEDGVTRQVKLCQFQLGYKGFIQLALRTGQYKQINDVVIYEGQLVSYNELTGELAIDFSKKISDKAVGYAFYFRLANGFEKTIYWPAERCESHGKRYSRSFTNRNSPWQTQREAMCLKTVIKHGLSKYGILSVGMQRALKHDQGAQVDIDADVVHEELPALDAPQESLASVLSDDKGKVEAAKSVGEAPAEQKKERKANPTQAPAESTPASTEPPLDRNKIMDELKELMLTHEVSEAKLFAYTKKLEGLVPPDCDELFTLPTATLAKLRAAVPAIGGKKGTS